MTSNGMDRLLFLASLSLFMGCCPARAQLCLVEYNFTCNSLSNATLDTAVYYNKYEDCYWSFRDENDTNLARVAPSRNVNTKCVPEIRLKIHCVRSTDPLLACYKQADQTKSEQSNSGTSHHRVREMVFIPVGLFLVMLGLFYTFRKAKKATDKTCIATAQDEDI